MCFRCWAYGQEGVGYGGYGIYLGKELTSRSSVIRHLSEVSFTDYYTREHYSVNTMTTRYVGRRGWCSSADLVFLFANQLSTIIGYLISLLRSIPSYHQMKSISPLNHQHVE